MICRRNSLKECDFSTQVGLLDRAHPKRSAQWHGIDNQDSTIQRKFSMSWCEGVVTIVFHRSDPEGINSYFPAGLFVCWADNVRRVRSKFLIPTGLRHGAWGSLVRRGEQGSPAMKNRIAEIRKYIPIIRCLHFSLVNKRCAQPDGKKPIEETAQHVPPHRRHWRKGCCDGNVMIDRHNDLKHRKYQHLRQHREPEAHNHVGERFKKRHPV